MVLYFSINRLLIHPIKELTHATKQIGYPDWHKPLGIKRHDEIGDLANAYDEMIESLNTRDEEVKLLPEASVAVSSPLECRPDSSGIMRKDRGLPKGYLLPHITAGPGHRLAGRQSCFTYTQYYCMETGYW